MTDMAEFDAFHEFGKELEERVRLQTFPIAVKMLKKESDIPQGAQRPMRDFGYHLATCQAFAMSRRDGTTVALLLEDMWCPESVIGYGLLEPPQYFLDGYHHYPTGIRSLEAGSAWAHQFPRLEYGKYTGVVSAPLTAANFVPDVVVIYCDSAQLGILLMAATCKDGRELTCTVSKGGACVYSVVPPMQGGNYQITLPCGGDRRFAAAQHDEMIFSLPIAKMEEFMSTLRYCNEGGYTLPFKTIMKPEPPLPDNYFVMGKLMGMDWMKQSD